MQLNSDTITLICTIGGSLGTAAAFIMRQLSKAKKRDLAREKRLVRIETKLDRAITDIDGIALAIGTKRAIAELAEKNKLKGDT